MYFDGSESRVIALAGRFIKNTVLRRHQIFDPEKGIMPDQQTMPSAPSAFFLLIFNNHRLIYFPETPYAPDLGAFEAAARKFIGLKYRQYIETLYRSGAQRGEPVTKIELRKLHGQPVVNIIPLSNEASIDEFLSRFSRLQRIEFELIKPNSETDGHAIWQQWRQMNGRLEPDKTVVRTDRAEGFDLAEAGKQIADAAASGNQRVRLIGRDENNNKLDGDNDSFKVVAPITDPPSGRRELASRLYTAFTSLLVAGTIRIDAPADDVRAKIRRLESG
jgi:hypothetical protein